MSKIRSTGEKRYMIALIQGQRNAIANVHCNLLVVRPPLVNVLILV